MVKFGVFQVGFQYFSITERLEIHENHFKSNFFVSLPVLNHLKAKKKISIFHHMESSFFDPKNGPKAQKII